MYMDGANMNAQVSFDIYWSTYTRILYITSCVNTKCAFICISYIGWTDEPRIHWSRCVPPQPPQDILYPTWWWWARHGPHWCKEASGPILTISSCGISSSCIQFIFFISSDIRTLTSFVTLLFLYPGDNRRNPCPRKCGATRNNLSSPMGICFNSSDFVHVHCYDGFPWFNRSF